MTKRLLHALLVVALALAFAGCNSPPDSPTSSGTTTSSNPTTESPNNNESFQPEPGSPSLELAGCEMSGSIFAYPRAILQDHLPGDLVLGPAGTTATANVAIDVLSCTSAVVDQIQGHANVSIAIVFTGIVPPPDSNQTVAIYIFEVLATNENVARALTDWNLSAQVAQIEREDTGNGLVIQATVNGSAWFVLDCSAGTGSAPESTKAAAWLHGEPASRGSGVITMTDSLGGTVPYATVLTATGGVLAGIPPSTVRHVGQTAIGSGQMRLTPYQ